MCLSGPKAPDPIKPVPPPPPPPADKPNSPALNEQGAENRNADSYVQNMRRGRNSLKIDRTTSVPSVGSGLNIPN